MSVVPIRQHSYDMLMERKNPMALRLADSHHQAINVGDTVEYQGHHSLMDRQRFTVISKIQHSTLESAMQSIDHSGLNTRDRIKMKDAFLGVHGPEARTQPVVTMHLEPHPSSSAVNRTVGGL
jgi:hypothetical protein